jgi:cytidine deaminase
MTPSIRRLMDAALAARKNAFCPLTGYSVGAAVLTASGRVIAGCNIESPTGIAHACAERVAIFNAYAHGERDIRAVCTASWGSFPCGSCRQVILELCGPRVPIYSIFSKPGAKNRFTKTTVSELLPRSHSSDTVKRGRKK